MIKEMVEGIIECWVLSSILVGLAIIIWVDWLGRGKTKKEVLKEREPD